MIITCEECQARFRLADEKLKPGGTKVRCSKCQHVFTVMPPEPAPAEESVDFGAFNMEPVAEEETAPAAPAPPPEPAPAAPPEPAPVAAGGEMDLDFSGLEQSLGPGGGDSEFAEEFSFADTAALPEAPAHEAIAPAEPASGFGELEFGAGEHPAELDFDATFAESEEPALSATPAEHPTEFTFDEDASAGTEPGIPFDSSALSFATEPPTPESAGFDLEPEATASAPGEFSLDEEPSAPAEFGFEAEPAPGLNEFSFETEAPDEIPAFGEEPTHPAAVESFDFGSGDSFESSAFDHWVRGKVVSYFLKALFALSQGIFVDLCIPLLGGNGLLQLLIVFQLDVVAALNRNHLRIIVVVHFGHYWIVSRNGAHPRASFSIFASLPSASRLQSLA